MPDIVVLVAGKKNGGTDTLYWKTPDTSFDIGDYAIVENMNGYDLIQIVGAIHTKKTLASSFSKTKYENMKNLITVIRKNDIVKENE